MSRYKLTIRHGPKVDRETHPTVEEAVASMRAHTERIRTEGGLPETSAFRTYEPGEQVEARLEISTGWLLGGRDGGVDVMGDGGLVPFRGGVSRKPLELAEGESAFDRVEALLRR